VLDRVKKTGKKKLVMAGLWTEVCLSMPVIDALADTYEVYIVTDAAGGGSTEGHERGVQGMVQAGAQPLTTIAYGLRTSA
jgi:nicotinamidase-related amidase